MPDAFEIFERLLDLPEAERNLALDEACGSNADVRREVMALLTADADADGFLEPDPHEQRAEAIRSGVLTSPGAASDGAPEKIGPYRIDAQIGEGGFGVVYRAEQIHPIERRVALKVIKPGMDSAAVLRRFDAERRALELLDHPNIARVLDAGLVPDGQPGAGRPFFAMELVEGRPITAYVNESSLPVDDRLGLASQICAAAQHAHTKAIVHRDLKPANILVADLDGRPACKVIDFGIAKALNNTDMIGAQITALTSPGAMVGTPQYMSPEQARGSTDIDTRTDVYAIGVVLYELLAGVPPFDAETLRSTDLESLRKLIETVDPPPPSASRAESHGDEPRLPRELDWITMRALEKDPDRRYPTVAALADDIERFRRSEPVAAARPSRVYRFSKFVRRNRGAVAAGCVAVLGIVAGSAFSVWFGVQADTARRAEAEQRRVAERNAERLTNINAFLTDDLFYAANPAELGPDATIPKLIEAAEPRIDARFGDDPAMLAEMNMLLGTMYSHTARYAESIDRVNRSIGLIDQGAEVPEAVLANALGGRGSVQVTTGDLDKAEEDAKRSITLVRGWLDAGVPGIDRATLAHAESVLAVALAAKNDLERAQPVFDRVLVSLRASKDDQLLMNTLSGYTSLLWQNARYEDALAASLEMTEVGDRLGGRRGRLGATTARFWMANYHRRIGQTQLAADLAQQILDSAGDLIGERSPQFANALLLSAVTRAELGECDTAAAHAEEAFAIFLEVFGSRHYEIERNANYIAGIHDECGNRERAFELRTRGLLLRFFIAGPGEAESVIGIMTAGETAYRSMDDWAARITEEFDTIAADDQGRAPFLSNAGLALWRAGYPDEAERAYLLAAEALPHAEHIDRTRDALRDRFCELLESTEREELAAEWHRRLSAE